MKFFRKNALQRNITVFARSFLLFLFYFPKTASAQVTPSVSQDASSLALFGVPISSLNGNTLFAVLIGFAIVVILALLIFGILLLCSTLLRFKYVSRERALAFGWNTMTENKGFFCKITLVVILFSNAHLLLLWLFQRLTPFSFRNALESYYIFSTPYTGEQLLFSLIGFLLSVYISAGVIRVSLCYVDGKKPEFSDLFVSLKLFMPFLIGIALYCIALFVGLLLFVIPGIFFASIFFFWQYRYIEGGGSLVASFRDSMKMTQGARWEVFLFWFLSQVIAFAGFIVLGIGYLFSFPVSALSLAIVYKSLKQKLNT